MDENFAQFSNFLQLGSPVFQFTISGGYLLALLVIVVLGKMRPAVAFGLSVGYFMLTAIGFVVLRLLLPTPSNNELVSGAMLLALPLVLIGNALFVRAYKKTTGAPVFDPKYQGLSFSEKRRTRDKLK